MNCFLLFSGLPFCFSILLNCHLLDSQCSSSLYCLRIQAIKKMSKEGHLLSPGVAWRKLLDHHLSLEALVF
jgi:hypothetical protein